MTGLEMGLEPVSDNPAELVLSKAREMDKYLFAHRIYKEGGEQGWIRTHDVTQPMPYGWREINDPSATVYGPPTVTISEAFDPRVMDRLDDLAKGLGIKHERKPNIGHGRALGYAERGGGVTTKFGGPESVLAHEIGHQLEWKFNISGLLKGKKGVPAELRALADLRFEGGDPSESYKKYVRNKDEKIANAIAALLYAPERFKQVAPETWDHLRDELWHIPALKPLFDIKPSMVLESRRAEVPVNGLVVRAKKIAPEPAAKVLNNYLSPGLRESSTIFRGYLGLANMMNQAQLGLSAFHLAFTTMDAATSKLALGIYQTAKGHPLKGVLSMLQTPISPITGLLTGNRMMKEWYTPGTQGEEFARLVDAVVEGGGRAKMDSFYHTSVTEKMVKLFREAIAPGRTALERVGKVAGGAVRSPFALIEQTARPLMEYIVPRQKLGVFADLARFELERLGPDAETEDVRAALGRAWDSVDNRMGQLVYDNLFWDKALKDLAMASVRSVGWNVGTVREILGGLGDTAKLAGRGAGAAGDVTLRREGKQYGPGIAGGPPDFTPRMSYIIALPVVAGLCGAILYYLWHGKAPETLKDYFFPRDSHGQRWSLPTYMKDVYNYGTDPMRTLRGKIHPLLSLIWEMLSNEDYFGREIHDHDDPVLKQMMDTVKYVGTEIEPMSLRQRKTPHRGLEEKILPFVGVTPAPKSLDQQYRPHHHSAL